MKKPTSMSCKLTPVLENIANLASYVLTPGGRNAYSKWRVSTGLKNAHAFLCANVPI